MNAPRWTIVDRVICRDGAPLLSILPASFGMLVGDLCAHRQRIVDLLNATELTTDALATLQYACMSTAAQERELADALPDPPADVARERDQRIGTLNMLIVTLNHVGRVYVQLDEEVTMKLVELELGDV